MAADKMPRGQPAMPMKLFAAWDIDRTRTSPVCIPRLCTLTVAHLHLTKPLGQDFSSVFIAVKMQNSKRTVRSNEIVLLPNGLLDVELYISFTLQYPHHLKGRENKLQLMLQRRKRYKNHTMLGYKTLAVTTVDMSLAMQKQMDLDQELLEIVKDNVQGDPVGRIRIEGVSSQPVDQVFEDDVESTTDDQVSDSEPAFGVSQRHRRRRRSKHRDIDQRSSKQKFFSNLLKKFKINEDLDNGPLIPSKLDGREEAIEQLLDQLENPSDSPPENEADTLSVSSTPKPSLRPFFPSSRSLVTGYDRHSDDNGSESECTDGEHSDPVLFAPAIKHFDKPKHRTIQHQLSDCFAPDEALPEYITISNSNEPACSVFASKNPQKSITSSSQSDIKEIFQNIVGRMQKICNTSSKTPNLKIVIFGSDSHISQVLRVYVDLFSTKTSDWCSFVKFYIVPTSVHGISRLISAHDHIFSSFFATDSWKNTLDQCDFQDVYYRVSRYLQNGNGVLQLPVAEAVITGVDEDTEQTFRPIPFLNEVRIGPLDSEEDVTLLPISPPEKAKEKLSPPGSPNLQIATRSEEGMELQIDYWTVTAYRTESALSPQPKKVLNTQDTSKQSLKGYFKYITIQKQQQDSQTFTLTFALKEKKQKLMRIGKKKEKNSESESKVVVDNVSRIIGLARSQNVALKMYIDGVESNGVKFFQLTSQWQSHARNFPVASMLNQE